MPLPRPLAPILIAAAVLALAGCGSGDPQDANEPSGDYQVAMIRSDFPTRQHLAEEADLVLGVENTGTEPLPELVFTVFTDEGDADGSFNIRSDQPGLANPNRPVWILHSKYPRFVDTPPPKGISGGLRAQTNTFGFGPLDPGESQEVVWRVTAVQPGTYTLSYIVEAGLDGNARAVTASGEQVEGRFVVNIAEKPVKQRVNGKGQVVPKL